jgi:adenylate kinase
MLNIALFGPPGAGKGTQSETLARQFNLCYISTGDLLRKELARQTPLGEEAREIIASGGLVPDEIIVQIIEKTITENPRANGFLFDGFPRTYVQAYILEGLMLKLHTKLDCLFNLEIPDDIALERLLERGRTSGRSDDNAEVIANRLREYHSKTLPVLNFFRDKGIVQDIDGTQAIDAVKDNLVRLVKKEQSKQLTNIILFGYPGSGRGSQGKALAERFGLEYIATGRILEAEIKAGTPLGKKVQELYENGQLVPDELVVPLIEKKIAEADGIKGFIFKGYPRTLVQSYILDGMLQKHGSSVSKIISLEVPTLELIRRLDERSKTPRCQPYDSSTARIVKRLHEHEKKTIPVIEKYQELHGVTRVDGTGTFEAVHEALAGIVSELIVQ